MDDKGDTLRLTQITDRTRALSRDRFRERDQRAEVRVDTVYIVKRDSVLVAAEPGSAAEGPGSGGGLLAALRWIFAIVCAVIVLVVVVRFNRF